MNVMAIEVTVKHVLLVRAAPKKLIISDLLDINYLSTHHDHVKRMCHSFLLEVNMTHTQKHMNNA